MGNIAASWTIELHADCPKCNAYVDLMKYPDFWDGRPLGVGEHDTDRSKDVDVVCPDCGHEFVVDLFY